MSISHYCSKSGFLNDLEKNQLLVIFFVVVLIAVLRLLCVWIKQPINTYQYNSNQTKEDKLMTIVSMAVGHKANGDCYNVDGYLCWKNHWLRLLPSTFCGDNACGSCSMPADCSHRGESWWCRAIRQVTKDTFLPWARLRAIKVPNFDSAQLRPWHQAHSTFHLSNNRNHGCCWFNRRWAWRDNSQSNQQTESAWHNA